MSKLESLNETQYELRQLRSSEQFGFGLHLGDELAVGGPGIPVSEITYDPSRHPVDAIDSTALMSTLEGEGGMPYVTQVVPFRKVSMNIVVHNDYSPEKRTRLPHYIRPIIEHQLILADSIKSSIDECAQYGDETQVHVIGKNNPYKSRADVNFVHAEDGEAFARQAAEIASRGLTFIISTYHNVPLRKLKEVAQERPLIAVKANHKLHLEYPADVGDLPTDNGKMVNTNDPKELAAVNDGVKQNHQLLEHAIKRSGLALARIVYLPGMPQGFDIKKADKSLASALSSLAN